MLEILIVDEKIILKWIRKKFDTRDWVLANTVL
jgi:hypothetical protein